MKKHIASTFAFIVLFSVSVFAGDLQPVYEALKDVPADYEPTGQVCEQVARLELYEEYPEDTYQINIGVEYSVQQRTVGELDVVIVHRKTRDVVLVGEVKCWRNMGGALDKAKDQRSRFIRTLETRKGQIEFTAHEGGEFHAGQFKRPKFVSIAQSGCLKHGFDMDLDYTLHELMELRKMLLRCQSQGECPRP